jgi:nucleotidyltransferase/DNA polymerase involved in DNA repair
MTLYACVQIPHLAVAIARRDQPALTHTPLILYTSGPRTTVYAAAPETSAPLGLPLRQALLRAPQAVCRPANPDHDQAVVAGLVGLLETFSPRVAAIAAVPDAIIDLDLGRCTLSQAMALTERIRAAICMYLRLLPALGLARTRGVARVAAATAGAGAAVVVPPGREASFLAPLPISALPLDDAVARQLTRLGLRTSGSIAALPLDALQAQFGAYGSTLHRLVKGDDDAPILANPSAPRIALTRRFDGPLTNRVLLDQALRGLATELAARLAAGGWAAQALTLTLRFEHAPPWIEQRLLLQPTAVQGRLAEALVALLARAHVDEGIESLTVAVAQLRPTVAAQLELFASPQGQARRLDDTLQRLVARYRGCFVRAALTDPAAYLPEQRVRFDPLERP